MGVAEGAAATLLVDLEALPPASAPRFVALDGWRVGWTCDVRAILIGERPTRAENNGPAATTRRVSYPVGGAPSSAPAGEVRWTEGPTMSYGQPAAVKTVVPLPVRGRTIYSRAGRVVLTETDRAGRATERDVGPGIPLAATRGGRFILALAPRRSGAEHDSTDHAIVYRVP
jgi:hypothetical protein